MMHNILNALLQVSIYSSALIIITFFISKVFSSKLSPKIVHILWLIVLLRLLLPLNLDIGFNLPLPSFKEEPAPTVKAEEVDTNYIASNDALSYEITDTLSANTIDNPVQTDANSSSEVNTKRLNVNLEKLALVIWLSGVVVISIWNAMKILLFGKNLNSTQPCDKYKAELKPAKSILGIKKNIAIVESKYNDVPFVYSAIKPRIVIPTHYIKHLGQKKISYIIMHELCHIKRRDVLLNYIWLFAKAIHWFNPFIYLAHRYYKDTIEECCDETVASYLNDRKKSEYTQSLIDAMRFTRKRNNLPLSASFLGNKSAIRKRVMKMINPQKKSKTMLFITILLAVIMVVGCFTTACQPAVASVEETLSNDTNITTVEPNAEATENPESTSVKQISLEKGDSTKPIKQAPVNTKDEAIEIAKNINISNSESFTYTDTYEYGAFKYHVVNADNDALTSYHIYDFNGEIMRLQTQALCTDEIGENLSDKELISKVVEFTKLVYPNTTLSIISCEKDDYIREVEGVQLESKDYIIKGRLIDHEEDSVRKFTSYIRLDGCVHYVQAEYNDIDFIDIESDVKDMLLQYAESDDAEINLFQIDDYYGNRMLHFSLGKTDVSVSLLASDMSFVDYCSFSNVPDKEYTLTEYETNDLIQKYADFYFPDNTSVVIETSNFFEKQYVGQGKLTDSRGEMPFYIQLNGDGAVHKIGISPNVDKESLPTIDRDTAYGIAVETLTEYCSFIDKSRLELIDESEYNNEYTQGYTFEIKYTSLSPSIHDYSLTSKINIDIHRGKSSSLRVDYIEDGLDLVSKEEAKQKAREYIVDYYNLDPEKLVFKELLVMTGNILEFQVNFDYENGYSYSASMFADTGARDGVGRGSN